MAVPGGCSTRCLAQRSRFGIPRGRNDEELKHLSLALQRSPSLWW